MAAKQILIVDDTREISRLLDAALHVLDAKLQIKVVPSAEEAFIEVSRRLYDLLIVDVRLPGISGLEFTQKVRSVRKNIRIIQISGMTDPGLKDNAISMGADVFLPKPLAMGEFLSTVEGLLDVDPFIPPSAVPQVPSSANPIPDVAIKSAPLTSLPDISAPPRKSEPLPDPSQTWPAPPRGDTNLPGSKPISMPETGSRPLSQSVPPLPPAPSMPTAQPQMPQAQHPTGQPPKGSRPLPAKSAPLPDLLTTLRQRFNAVLVAVADLRGRVVARAGDLPDFLMDPNIVMSLMASASATAAACRLVNPQAPESTVIVRAQRHDILTAPLTPQSMILIVVERTDQGLYLAQILEDLSRSYGMLIKSVSQLSMAMPRPSSSGSLTHKPTEGAPRQQPPVSSPLSRPAAPVTPPGLPEPQTPVNTFDTASELDALLNPSKSGSKPLRGEPSSPVSSFDTASELDALLNPNRPTPRSSRHETPAVPSSGGLNANDLEALFNQIQPPSAPRPEPPTTPVTNLGGADELDNMFNQPPPVGAPASPDFSSTDDLEALFNQIQPSSSGHPELPPGNIPDFETGNDLDALFNQTGPAKTSARSSRAEPPAALPPSSFDTANDLESLLNQVSPPGGTRSTGRTGRGEPPSPAAPTPSAPNFDSADDLEALFNQIRPAATSSRAEPPAQASDLSVNEDLEALFNTGKPIKAGGKRSGGSEPVDDLDALLNQSTPNKMKADELDAFWEQLASGKSSESDSSAGTLSYEQAARLGLTPQDPNER